MEGARSPWTKVRGFTDKIQLLWSPRGVHTDCPWTKKLNLGGDLTRNIYPKNFQKVHGLPWNSMEFRGVLRSPQEEVGEGKVLQSSRNTVD